MRIFSVILLLGFCGNLFAQCQQEPVRAVYEIDHQPGADGASNQRHLTLWRINGQVALENTDLGITELWHRTGNGRLHLIRYFDQYQRGIEYQPSEIRSSHSSDDWSHKYQLLSDQLIQNLTLTGHRGEGCLRTESYSSKTAAAPTLLTWLPAYRLPQTYALESPTATVSWKLIEIETNQTVIAQRFEQLSSYQTTDYADIGDNESDPFLSKMINLGFVAQGAKGFYDAEGNSMDSDHHH